MSDEHYPMLIGDQWVEADDNGRFEVDDPATGETVATVADGGVAEMVRAIDAARSAVRSSEKSHSESWIGWRRSGG